MQTLDYITACRVGAEGGSYLRMVAAHGLKISVQYRLFAPVVQWIE